MLAISRPVGPSRDWREVLPVRFVLRLNKEYGPVEILDCQELIPDPYVSYSRIPADLGYRLLFKTHDGFRLYVRMFRKHVYPDLPQDDDIVMFYASGI